jgi:hypothetical protein
LLLVVSFCRRAREQGPSTPAKPTPREQSCLVGCKSALCVGQFDARVAEQLDDPIRGLVREVGCPGDQQVVVADVTLGGLERLESPEPETARGLDEAEARPPGDVLEPRLGGPFEQRPGRFGRFDISVPRSPGVGGEVVLVEREQRREDGIRDVVGLNLRQPRARRAFGAVFEFVVSGDELIEDAGFRPRSTAPRPRGSPPGRSSSLPPAVRGDDDPELASGRERHVGQCDLVLGAVTQHARGQSSTGVGSAIDADHVNRGAGDRGALPADERFLGADEEPSELLLVTIGVDGQLLDQRIQLAVGSCGMQCIEVGDQAAPPSFVLKIGRQGAGVNDEAALEFDQPRHRVLLDHRRARQIGLEEPDVNQPVDDRGLVGHRRLHDAERLGELLGGHVRRLCAVEEEVDPADRVDRSRRPDPRVTTNDRRGSLAPQPRHEPSGHEAVLLIEVLPARSVGDIDDLLRPITQRSGDPQVVGGHAEMLARAPDAHRRSRPETTVTPPATSPHRAFVRASDPGRWRRACR